MSRSIVELSRRDVYLIEIDPADCSPDDLKVKKSELESMWIQFWSVLHRIFMLEDLILMSPDPDGSHIDELLQLVVKSSGYACRGPAKLCSPAIRKGLDDVSAILDWILLEINVDGNLPDEDGTNSKTGLRTLAMRT